MLLKFDLCVSAPLKTLVIPNCKIWYLSPLVRASLRDQQICAYSDTIVKGVTISGASCTYPILDNPCYPVGSLVCSCSERYYYLGHWVLKSSVGYYSVQYSETLL